jgi:hypothetical protein
MQSASSPVIIALVVPESAFATTSSLSSSSSPHSLSQSSNTLPKTSSTILSSFPETTQPSLPDPSHHDPVQIQSALRPSATTQKPYSTPTALSNSFQWSNSTRLTIGSHGASGNVSVPGRCTGCEIEIHDPVTTFFAEGNQWTSFVITETVLSEFTTYMKNNATIDTIVTSVRTVNQTRTIINNEDQTITRSTPAFTITPKPGTYLTLDAGPTYVIYKDFFGALDSSVGRASSGLQATVTVCSAQPTQLKKIGVTLSKRTQKNFPRCRQSPT